MKKWLQVRIEESLKIDVEKTAESIDLSVSEYIRVLHIVSRGSSYDENGNLTPSAMTKIEQCLSYFKKKFIAEERNNKLK